MKYFALCITAIICSMFFILPAGFATQPTINVDKAGIAIKGYDTVAYFTLGRPVKGQKEFRHDWQDARWLFANRDHLNLFKESPEKFAPQYGGY